ncbi:MAG: alpha/beta fold hydrolase [Planctomycetota bacterium]
MGDTRMGLTGAESGHTRGGLPYNRFGGGPGNLVVFQGMQFVNRPLSGLPARLFRNLYRRLETRYTLFLLTRRPGLPEGYSLRDMSNDYAATIREELDGPVDVVGLSTGGLIAQHFAADHPDLVRRLVLHSSAHHLSDGAKRLQERVCELALERRWRAAYATVFAAMAPRRGVMGGVANVTAWLAAPLGGLLLGRPSDPSDLAVTYAASNAHEFADQLARIQVPTLVVGGERDPFYTPASFRETAEGIPNARLILYERMGHPASGKRFARDLLEFLAAQTPD